MMSVRLLLAASCLALTACDGCDVNPLAFLTPPEAPPSAPPSDGPNEAPQICPQPSVLLEFGRVKVGLEAHRSTTFTSCGSQPLTIQSITVEGGNGYFALEPPVALPLTLPVSAALELGLTYAPLVPGAHTGSVRVVSDDPLAPEGWISLV